MPLQQLTDIDIRSLASIANQFGDKENKEKYALLQKYSTLQLQSVSVIKKYHDLLLFLKAYPGNNLLLQKTNDELNRIAERMKAIMTSGAEKKQLSFSGSGIANSMLTCQYSYPLVKWLVKEKPGIISFYATDADDETAKTILQKVFPGIEYCFTTQGNLSAINRIIQLCGRKHIIENLVHAFEYGIADDAMRSMLFDQLKIYISWELNDNFHSHTYLQAGFSPVYFQRTAFKKNYDLADFFKIIPAKIKLNREQKHKIVNIARASLAFYYRETEPVTYVNEAEVQLYNCGHGISIALFGIDPARQLSIETYIGYMLFKNNVPLAYGGAWIFGDRCKIGLNIYPPFRRGEAAALFGAIMNLYKRLYRLERFVIKPYQFGKGNKEGLQSGAFWFYYKLGFRPADKKIAVVAEDDFLHARRSSIAQLRYFTNSNLELTLNPLLPADMDPENISRKISQWIIKDFKGRRDAAIQYSVAALKKLLNIRNKKMIFHNRIESLALMIAFIDNKNWSEKDKKYLIQILLSGVSDVQYILAIQQARVFMNKLFEKFIEVH